MSVFLKFLLTVLIFSLSFLVGCAKKPVLGTPEFTIINHQQELALGEQTAEQILSNESVVKDPRYTARVEEVFKKLIRALPPKYRNSYEWKVYVLDKNVINAFALPNGNIFVYKGLLDFVKRDDELAAVLGHEIAHVILRHVAERISWALATQLAGDILLARVSPSNRELAQKLYSLGVNIGFLLPYSRKQEKEADIVGVLIMMRAGYNPEGAVKLWRRMLARFKGKEPPEFLSDHPATEKRLEYIRKVVEFLENHPKYVREFKIPPKLLKY